MKKARKSSSTPRGTSSPFRPAASKSTTTSRDFSVRSSTRKPRSWTQLKITWTICPPTIHASFAWQPPLNLLTLPRKSPRSFRSTKSAFTISSRFWRGSWTARSIWNSAPASARKCTAAWSRWTVICWASSGTARAPFPITRNTPISTWAWAASSTARD